VGDAFAGPLTVHDLGSEKEILDLVFGKSGVVRGPDNAWTNQTKQRGRNEPSPLLMKNVHRSTSPNYAHRAYSFSPRTAT
jgi:hypothetical protein